MPHCGYGAANRAEEAEVKDILGELEDRRAAARQGGGDRRIAAQHSKGKLTARERIALESSAALQKTSAPSSAGRRTAGHSTVSRMLMDAPSCRESYQPSPLSELA